MQILVDYDPATGFTPHDPIAAERLSALKPGGYKIKITRPRVMQADEETRTIAQNKLLHDICRDVSKTTVNEWAGWTEAEAKHLLKFLFLWDLYMTHNIKGMAEILNPMMKGYSPAQYDFAKWRLIQQDWITSRDLTVEQFTLWLNQIIHWARMEGIQLKIDQDIYEMAMQENNREYA